ncbi:MAG TPA: hypothetical protein VMJ72_03055 [Candidatus Paceibacterota bacterium]|nr:hypothetical protein [Candidatus Paceibacterota bacterium]
MVSAIAVVSLLLAGAPTSSKPHLQLVANPQLSVLPFPNARPVCLTAIVRDADEATWYPGVAVDWGDGDRSLRDGEVRVPFTEADPDDVARSVVFIGRHEFWRGAFTITVRLFHGNGKQVLSNHIEITVK